MEHVLAYINTSITNIIGDWINRIIKIVKTGASECRILDAFADMIYLTVGDINIPEEIPAQVHTL